MCPHKLKYKMTGVQMGSSIFTPFYGYKVEIWVMSLLWWSPCFYLPSYVGCFGIFLGVFALGGFEWNQRESRFSTFGGPRSSRRRFSTEAAMECWSNFWISMFSESSWMQAIHALINYKDVPRAYRDQLVYDGTYSAQGNTFDWITTAEVTSINQSSLPQGLVPINSVNSKSQSRSSKFSQLHAIENSKL